MISRRVDNYDAIGSSCPCNDTDLSFQSTWSRPTRAAHTKLNDEKNDCLTVPQRRVDHKNYV